jgi:hypothetical protein
MYVASSPGASSSSSASPTSSSRLTRPDPERQSPATPSGIAEQAQADREAAPGRREAARVDVDAWLDYPEGGQP